MPDNDDGTNGTFHLDKRLPLALIIAIIVQTGGAFWWASAVANRLDDQQRRIETSERGQLEMLKVMTDLRVTLVELKTEISVRRTFEQQQQQRTP